MNCKPCERFPKNSRETDDRLFKVPKEISCWTISANEVKKDWKEKAAADKNGHYFALQAGRAEETHCVLKNWKIQNKAENK